MSLESFTTTELIDFADGLECLINAADHPPEELAQLKATQAKLNRYRDSRVEPRTGSDQGEAQPAGQ
tara:strand:+ start:743 stop:943 length:201 start_codon:yes stop_codon:yes gene_type:complete